MLLVLPGSRRREVAVLAPIFGAALGLLAARGLRFELVLPTLPRLEATLRAAAAGWPVAPRIVTGEAERQAAFRVARAALAASGTVTLELALAAVPTIGAYRLPGWEAFIARRVLVDRRTVILPKHRARRGCGAGTAAGGLRAGAARRCAGAAARARPGPRRAAAALRPALDALMASGGGPAAEIAAETVLAVVAAQRQAKPSPGAAPLS